MLIKANEAIINCLRHIKFMGIIWEITGLKLEILSI